MRKIVIANPKGGVGKSLLAILLTEWLESRGIGVDLVDADQNRTVGVWKDLCRQKGRLVGQGHDLQVVDTAGLPGTLFPYVEDADLVLCPLEPLTPVISRLVVWVGDLSASVRSKLALVPNRLRSPNLTRDEHEGLKQVAALLDGYQLEQRQFLPGLSDRRAVYGRLYNGSQRGFFDWEGSPSVKNAQEEARAVFVAVEALLAERIR